MPETTYFYDLDFGATQNTLGAAGVLDRIQVTGGFPVLDEAFGTSLSGLYLPGFTATRDFGPFFGFVKGTPTAATLIVQDLLARA